MGRQVIAFVSRLADAARAAASTSRSTAVLGIAGAFVIFVGITAVAPALVSFALSVTVATARCMWLEKHWK